MYIVIYQKNTIKNIISSSNDAEKTIETLKSKNIIQKDDEYKIFDNIQNMGVKDIRAINDDGSVMSLEEQIKNKIVVLEKDEEIRNGQIYKLNKNIEEDLIKLIELGIEKLDKNKKIVERNDKKYITEKSMEEKLKEGLITQEEYNNHIIQLRQSLYYQNLDGKRAELLDNVLHKLASQGLLTDEQKVNLNELEDIRKEIKESNPKAEVLLKA
ncbi:phage tail protein [Brachyspira pilosicoli]|uniref:phage tail protein n=1 Tax=Brachyspira pilosicoli TaxID=52584 RepID=UPI000E1484B8|nr:phage tail protein [Brachyspira pilosicoli]SUW04286.1 Hvp 28 VSH-1 tail protein [Brachyspira pilosicoli]SUW07951.1 Hvp 28 VSH-1 tail protein [Brachyspira pilosicoli]SUW21354.1 Hvp 28 VSH-1 tail protein [Brachyspira pilosicoli]